jgi:hypothetical protein
MGSQILTDNVRPGPLRWKRAVDAAIAKPESHHAALLFERLNRVRGLATTPTRYWKVERHERNHYYCSDFCVGLAIHLEAYIGDRGHQFSSYEDIIDKIRNTHNDVGIDIGWGTDAWSKTTLRQTFPRTLPRIVKCFTCGGEMSKNYLTSGNPLVSFTYARSLAKEYAPKADVKEVTAAQLKTEPVLTEWERDLLRGADAGKVWISVDGHLVYDRPTDYMEINLTKRELAILKFVEKDRRHEALNALKYV